MPITPVVHLSVGKVELSNYVGVTKTFAHIDSEVILRFKEVQDVLVCFEQ